MLNNTELQKRYVQYLRRQQKICAGLLKSSSARQKKLLNYYIQMYQNRAELYQKKYERDLIEPLAQLSELGVLELLSTAATHSFLPLFQNHPDIVRQQIHLGLRTHLRFSRTAPTGFWPLECGFLKDSTRSCLRRDSAIPISPDTVC